MGYRFFNIFVLINCYYVLIKLDGLSWHGRRELVPAGYIKNRKQNKLN